MRQNNLIAWTYIPSLECLLFFAQRLDELLFHHTTDTYRCSTLSIRGLAAEYCTVYRDVKSGVLNKKNLTYIIQEFADRLKNDDVAKEILSAEFVTRFLKNYQAWDIKCQYENMQYAGRRLSNRAYFNHVVTQLKKLITENKQKRAIDINASAFIREALDCGYNENYVFSVLHEVFFHKEVTSLDSLDEFFGKFDFALNKYDVYIGYSRDMSSLFPLFENLEVSDLKVSMVDSTSVPSGIKTKRQKTILKFEAIESYDIYSAYDIANAISSCVVNSYSFFRHDPNEIRTYGQVVDKDHVIVTINPQKLLKTCVSALSREDSTKNAEGLLKILFANYENLSSFSKVTKTHNAAICSESTSDSILSLWSILEAIVEDDNDAGDEKIASNEDKKERSKIGNIISYSLPYLKSTYVRKLVQTCMSDLIRWDENFFRTSIANNGFGETDLEHTFAFLAFQETQDARDNLYQKTELFPLLRYRVSTLYEQLHNTKHIKSIIFVHAQRIEWHIHRIYRARNYIIHDADENDQLNHELVINLHSYVDILISEIIAIISNSPYNDSIHHALVGHKLACTIMTEKMDKQPNEEITVSNALQYLYYDFER